MYWILSLLSVIIQYCLLRKLPLSYTILNGNFLSLVCFTHQISGEYSGGTLHLGGAGTLLVVFGGAW